MSIAPYRALRIRFQPAFRPMRTCARGTVGWTADRNRIFHGLRSTRPTVAPPVPDGGRVTGPDGPGRGTGPAILRRILLPTVHLQGTVGPGPGNLGRCTGPGSGTSTRIRPALRPGGTPAPGVPVGGLDGPVPVLRILDGSLRRWLTEGRRTPGRNPSSECCGLPAPIFWRTRVRLRRRRPGREGGPRHRAWFFPFRATPGSLWTGPIVALGA